MIVMILTQSSILYRKWKAQRFVQMLNFVFWFRVKRKGNINLTTFLKYLPAGP